MCDKRVPSIYSPLYVMIYSIVYDIILYYTLTRISYKPHIIAPRMVTCRTLTFALQILQQKPPTSICNMILHGLSLPYITLSYLIWPYFTLYHMILHYIMRPETPRMVTCRTLTMPAWAPYNVSAPRPARSLSLYIYIYIYIYIYCYCHYYLYDYYYACVYLFVK